MANNGAWKVCRKRVMTNNGAWKVWRRHEMANNGACKVSRKHEMTIASFRKGCLEGESQYN
jgi:hypothetical protein